MGILIAKIFEMEKQIHSMNSTINPILTQLEELGESFCNILQRIKAIAATALMVEGIQPCLAELLAKYDSLVMTTEQLNSTVAATEDIRRCMD